MLGNSKDAYNQIWNLPTDNKKLTGEQWIELFAKKWASPIIPGSAELGSKSMGLFVPVLREMVEMLYQYDRDIISTAQSSTGSLVYSHHDMR